MSCTYTSGINPYGNQLTAFTASGRARSPAWDLTKIRETSGTSILVLSALAQHSFSTAANNFGLSQQPF